MKKPRNATVPSSEKKVRVKAAPSAGAAAHAGTPFADDRRAELVLAAYALIAEKGIEGLRTRDIAAKVGINISTLHYYFDTKEKLIAAVVDHVNHLFQTIRAPARVGATPLEELRQLLESQTYRQRVAPELGIVIHETMLRARRDESVRAAFDSTLRMWRIAVEELVARCIREGYLRQDLAPKPIAETITSCLIGATLQLGIRPSNYALGEGAQTLVSLLLAPEATTNKKRK